MGNEQDLLRKISGLLAKAESTDNEHEASAFFDKAHELMVTYAIDEARIRVEQKRLTGRQVEEPVVEDYMFSSYAHHAQAKQELLEIVCKAHSVCSLTYSNRKYSNANRVAAAGSENLHESQWTRLVGFKDDLEAVKLLYLSLLIQSQRFAQEDWRARYGDEKRSSWEDGRLGKFTWMSGHMAGFAHRIGERFRESTEAIYSQILDSKALILDKDANILEWMYEHGLLSRPRAPKEYCWALGVPPKKRSQYYCIKAKGHNEGEDPTPHAFTYKPSYSSYMTKGRAESYEGQNAGRSAADRADIGQTRIGNDAKLLA